MKYTYRGDRLTDPHLRGMQCDPVLHPDGKCKRGKNANMLVINEDGQQFVVLARLLRKNS